MLEFLHAVLGIHWCAEETRALLLALGPVGVGINWLRMKWSLRGKRKNEVTA